MLTRRNLFKGLFSVVGAVVLKPFVKAETKKYHSFLIDEKYISHNEGRWEDKFIGKWDEVLNLPYIDLNDGQTGYVKYTTKESESWKDGHLRLTSDYREKGLDITLTDGSLIRVTAKGSWMHYNIRNWVHGSKSIDDVCFEIPQYIEKAVTEALNLGELEFKFREYHELGEDNV